MKNAMVRNRRWLMILLGAVVLSALAAGLRWNRSPSVQSRPPLGDVTTILVAPFAVHGNRAEPWSGARLAEEVRTALDADKAVVIRRLEPTVGAEPPRPPDADGAREIDAAGRITADYVLTGTVGRKERSSEIGLRLIRSDDASTAWTGTFWRSSADLPSLAGDLAAAVREAIHAERERAARARELQPRPAERPLR